MTLEQARKTFIEGILEKLPASFKVRVVDHKLPSEALLFISPSVARDDLVPVLADLMAKAMTSRLPSNVRSVDLYVGVSTPATWLPTRRAVCDKHLDFELMIWNHIEDEVPLY